MPTAPTCAVAVADPVLLPLLQALEVELHRPAARQDAARLDALLHGDFREFGRSGAVYTKADVLSQLPAQARHAVVFADRFEMRRLGDGIALLTYRSAHRQADGTLDGWTLRTSVWEWSPHGWQMRFHQGTPAAPGGPDDPGETGAPAASADGAPPA